MFIRLFRSQQPLGYMALGITALLLWTLGYIRGFRVIGTGSMPLYDLVVAAHTAGHTMLYFLAGFVLIASQALHLNAVVNKHEVLNKSSWFPGFLYLLTACCIPEMIAFNPVLLVNSLLILVLDKILMLYKNDAPLPLVFDSCLLLAIATLLYVPAFFFVLLFMAGLIILRPFSWRNWVMALMGFATPFFFYVLYYFMTDDLDGFVRPFMDPGISLEFTLRKALPPGYSITAGYILLVLILSATKIRATYFKNVARARNFQEVILMAAVSGLILILFTRREQFFRYQVLHIPLAILMSVYFLEAKKIWRAETLVYLFFVIIVFNFLTT